MAGYFDLLDEVGQLISAGKHFFFFECFDVSHNKLFKLNKISIVGLIEIDVDLFDDISRRRFIVHVEVAEYKVVFNLVAECVDFLFVLDEIRFVIVFCHLELGYSLSNSVVKCLDCLRVLLFQKQTSSPEEVKIRYFKDSPCFLGVLEDFL